MNKEIREKVISGKYEAKRLEKNQKLLMGKRIRELREKADLDLIYVANVLGIGDDMMARLENGRSTLRTEHIYVLSRLYDVSAHYIMFGEDEKILLKEIDNMCFGKNDEMLKKAIEILRILFR